MTGQTAPDALGFGAYQQAAAQTSAVVAADHPIVYPALGLANEAGEVAGKVKKILRDRQGRISDADRRPWPWSWAMCCGTCPRCAPGSGSGWRM
jgi:hypothetical protein